MRAHNEEMLRAARTHYRLFPMLPTTWNKFKMEWSMGRALGGGCEPKCAALSGLSKRRDSM